MTDKELTDRQSILWLMLHIQEEDRQEAIDRENAAIWNKLSDEDKAWVKLIQPNYKP